MQTEGRPRRSDATKEAIRNAARERFAKDGYERATIRAIAADAGIDPSMVMRYFGSKDRLFAAAADFDLRLPDPLGVPREEVGRVFAAHFVARWDGDETLMALLRSAVTHPAAAERMREVFAGQLAPAVLAVAPDRPEQRAGLVATQVLGVALTRYVLRLPPVTALERDEIVAWLGPVLQHYLTGSENSATP
ncbi:TetR family transcriptional regulator [Actinocorallia sp. A-T 12471]|uniref:TetR/AcrR family transcriptional regulator n=1 Tax=Actinocorallia sp. A-T 12471 TaxID=3089813 RepID=UPI0029D01E7C|nr:TetR family transcriptional regulator [Actinocorallia sp. A-T 12471]MDX6742283.1 TetR family transcriptional regulator [Actinocorallia sp. A-T 12471]